MRLASLAVRSLGLFEEFALSLADETGGPRGATLLFGADGTGKTTLLSLLSSTRPGHAVAPLLPPSDGERRRGGHVVTEWHLGDDDADRPHPLVVASPSAELPGEEPDRASLRRREQMFFDRRAQEGRGYVFVAFSGARWFSRAPNILTTPDRSVLRYDVRAPASFDDATRADLERDTKQTLSFAAIASSLAPGGAWDPLTSALREALGVLLRPYGLEWVGVRPATLEPELVDAEGHRATFDEVPRGAKQLAAIGSLVVRSLFAAYRESDVTVRSREAVVALDDAEVHLDVAAQRALVPLLREALPRVQWVVTTSSPIVALGCDPSDVVALRVGDDGVELHEGPLAVLH